MKIRLKISITVITIILAIILITLVYRSSNLTLQNHPYMVNGVATTTSFIGGDIFKDTDCATASLIPNSTSSVEIVRYSDSPVENKIIKEKTTHSSIDIQYPNFTNGAVVKKLNTCIYSLVSYILADDQKRIKDIAKDNPTVYKNSPWESSVNLVIDYNLSSIRNGIVSLEITVTDFTGGGNGNHDVSYPINWDLKSDRLLSPDNLFCSKDYVSTLMPLVRKQLLENYNQDTYGFVHPLLDSVVKWINDGTENYPSNWQNFVLRDDGVVAIFQPYQVASGMSGIVRAFIPDSPKLHLLCLP